MQPLLRGAVRVCVRLCCAVCVCLRPCLRLADEAVAARGSAADAHVINVYQLLKSLNPGMEVSAEVMLPQNMSFMAPTPPACDTLSSRPHLLSPAYMSGSGARRQGLPACARPVHPALLCFRFSAAILCAHSSVAPLFVAI